MFCLIPKIRILCLRSATMPEYKTPGAAAFDLSYTPEYDNEALRLGPGDKERVPTGLIVQIQKHWEGRVSLRGSTGDRQLIMLNAPGIIDSDFRDEVILLLKNISDKLIVYNPGDRIAQMKISWAPQAKLIKVSKINVNTKRGTGKLGSTGV